MANKISSELHLISTDPEHPVYEIIPEQPVASTEIKLGSAASRRCFDPRALHDIAPKSPEKTPINEVEAMARIYKGFGVSAVTMASSPLENKIYDLSDYANVSND